MTKGLRVLVAILALGLVADAALAQRPGRGRGERPRFGGPARPRFQPGPGHRMGQRPGPGRFGGRFGGMMVNPLMRALDLDHNGELSAEEIEKAAESLKKLDKNGDGKITPDELRPHFGPPGPGPGPGPRDFISRLMQLDKNKDGKITKDELPSERMQRLIERGDQNGDGALDKDEILQLRERFRRRSREGRPRGERPAEGAEEKPESGV